MIQVLREYTQKVDQLTKERDEQQQGLPIFLPLVCTKLE